MIWIFILLFIFLIIYSFLIEPFWLTLKRRDIFLKKSPTKLEGLKIIHLSDLHSSNFGYREKRVLEIISQEKADFIFVTGDINEAFLKEIDSCSVFWQKLRDLAPVYVVFGNHLFEDKKMRPDFFQKTLEKVGWQVLRNENVKLCKDKQCFWLLGVDDPHTHHHNLERALSGTDNSTIKILLSHSPEIIEDLSPGDVDLILGGHTHGGQVNIPGIPVLWAPTKYKFKYIRGLSLVKGAQMYINQGIGTRKLPVRFNSRPEVTLLTFQKMRA
ncbi:metallophosphoesterase [Patescibacteria group bacterium]|nr:metallophosphoesterase [Patescibacteria group bacterium]